ncbi:MAG: DinB family protein [Chloroflexi bacterium]|nr:DinB family protein [Chloroflexota bacterium]
MHDTLLTQLAESHRALSEMLAGLSAVQDRRPSPEAWSFRFVAGHMAQVELDCHLNRVWRIAAGEQPHFPYYTNTGWDFSHYTLEEWLYLWHGRRQELLQFVPTLTPHQLTLTATHELFGTITVADVLRIAHEHDSEHLADLSVIISHGSLVIGH